MSVTIRPATAETDWRKVHFLLQSAFSYMTGRIDPPSSLDSMQPEDLEALAAEGLALIGTDEDGDVVACAFLGPHPEGMAVSKLAVAPGLRRQGLARKMIKGAGEAARRLGLKALIVQTRIELTENHAAFAAMGFEKVGETSHPGYHRATSITMRKPLITGPAPTHRGGTV
ncbi:MAG: GNAT family N-acetyltransferase [Pseudomonadota bacterium]